jgi:hypothetical protein
LRRWTRDGDSDSDSGIVAIVVWQCDPRRLVRGHGIEKEAQVHLQMLGQQAPRRQMGERCVEMETGMEMPSGYLPSGAEEMVRFDSDCIGRPGGVAVCFIRSHHYVYFHLSALVRLVSGPRNGGGASSQSGPFTGS